ncbi:MAG: hypothetical protein JXB32_23625 [Deltaproteobacteria bacterium]|nr:hypothetical protein [Deltaproteobacteria bacterium]
MDDDDRRRGRSDRTRGASGATPRTGFVAGGPWLGGLLLPALFVPGVPAPARAETAPAEESVAPVFEPTSAPFVAVELHGSVISDIVSTSVLAGAFGYAVRGGYRWSSGWGVFGQLEQDFWYASEHEDALVEGVVDIGVGADYVYADGFVHTSLVMGPSILAFDTLLDDAGTVGFFFELRPVGLRWRVHGNVTLDFAPISFALVAPVLTRIPLIFPQYRTTFSVEFGW